METNEKKYNSPKFVERHKSSSKREVPSTTGLPPETITIPNKQSKNHKPEKEQQRKPKLRRRGHKIRAVNRE